MTPALIRNLCNAFALRVSQFCSFKKINGYNAYVVVAKAALRFSIGYKKDMVMEELQGGEKASL